MPLFLRRLLHSAMGAPSSVLVRLVLVIAGVKMTYGAKGETAEW